jgi:hypothetical protein
VNEGPDIELNIGPFGAEGGTMQRVPKQRSRESANSRSEMQTCSSVLMLVRGRPPKSAGGRRDCPQTCPHFNG